MSRQNHTAFAAGLLTKGLFCAAVLQAVAGSAAAPEKAFVAPAQGALVASFELGSLDDLVQSLTPRAKIQRAVPNTWSARFETRFNARWGMTGRYMV